MRSKTIYSVSEQIEDTSASRPHVTILGAGAGAGAGASLVACPEEDKYGHLLPLMDDLIDVLNLRPLLQAHAVDIGDTNFEANYCRLYADQSRGE